MKCTSPVTIRNPHYGVCDDYRPYLTVPCGRCVCCRNRKRNQWAFRMEQECKVCHTSYFVTLTYDDDHLPFDNDGRPVLRYRDVQLFFKRLRQYYPDANIRYLCVGEYGERFGRPHYHAIIFNIPDSPRDFHPDPTIGRFHFNAHLASIWKNGHVHTGDVTRKSILYCTKYCFKDGSCMRCSKRPFLGYSFLDCHLIELMVSDFNKSRVVPQHGFISQSDGSFNHVVWFLQLPDIYLRKMFKCESFQNLTYVEQKEYTHAYFKNCSRRNSERDRSPYQGDERWYAEFYESETRGRPLPVYLGKVIDAYVKECDDRLSRLLDYEARYLYRSKQDEATRFAYHKKNSPREYTLFT